MSSGFLHNRRIYVINRNRLCVPMQSTNEHRRLATWSVHTSSDVTYALIQTIAKTVLAWMGWWTVFVFPAQPIVSMTAQQAVAVGPPTYAYAGAFLYMIVDVVDILWHVRDKGWTNMAHHVGSLVGTCVCILLGPPGRLLINCTLILETAGPFYQLLKLRTHSALLQRYASEIRLLVLGINVCLREAYLLWLLMTLTTLAYDSTVASVNWTAIAGVIIWCIALLGLILDIIWSQCLIRGMRGMHSTSAGVVLTHVVVGVVACMWTYALYLRSNPIAVIVGTSCVWACALYYRSSRCNVVHVDAHVAAWDDRVCTIFHVTCAVGSMLPMVVRDPSVPRLVCLAVSIWGGCIGENMQGATPPAYANAWRALTCYVPATVGMVVV